MGIKIGVASRMLMESRFVDYLAGWDCLFSRILSFDVDDPIVVVNDSSWIIPSIARESVASETPRETLSSGPTSSNQTIDEKR